MEYETRHDVPGTTSRYVEKTTPLSTLVDIVAIAGKIAGLAARQKEVASCIVGDMTDEEIAKKLGLSKATPAIMLAAMYSSLGVPNDLPASERRAILKAATLKAIEPLQKNIPTHESIQEAPLPTPSPRDLEAKKPTRIPRPKEDSFSEEYDMTHVVVKLERAKKRLQDIAHCIAYDLDPSEEMGLTEATATVYVGHLYKALELPFSLGSKRRRRIVTEAYRLHESATASEETSVKISEPVAPVEHDPEPTEPPATVAVEEAMVSNKADAAVIEPSSRGSGADEETALPTEEMTSASEKIVPTAVQEAPTRRDVQVPTPVYGPGVSIVLDDPNSIVDMEVVAAEHESGIVASHIVRCKRSGLRPEIVVVYPTADPTLTMSHIIFVKRQR
jgi:hypothetical protein